MFRIVWASKSKLGLLKALKTAIDLLYQVFEYLLKSIEFLTLFSSILLVLYCEPFMISLINSRFRTRKFLENGGL